jgi:hypothetical protein
MEKTKMNKRPEIKISNVETGEEIIREMNDVEFAQYQTDKAEYNQSLEQQAETEAKRQALLNRLGITADEARLLLG